MSVVIFLVVLFVLVLVHEWGHFIVAKKTGMRVDEFGIGFPPKLYGRKKGETEYTLNALPLGGFVRIYGENKEEMRDGETPDTARAFSSRPKWAQALVLVAGVVMNVLFAWLLFTIVLLVGVPTAVDESVATDAAELYVASVLPDSPAADIIPPGATITSVAANDEMLTAPNPTSFSEFVNAHAPQPLTITYEYLDEHATVELMPEQGLSVEDQDRYLVGASLTMVETVSQPIHLAIVDGLTTTINGLHAISVGLWTLLHDAVAGEADFSTVAGPVGIVGMVDQAAAFGVVALLSFTAIISLNLAIINLLPFPALDGGRLLFVAIEAITRREIPPVWAGWLNAAGFVVLMGLMVAVTYNDIVRLL